MTEDPAQQGSLHVRHSASRPLLRLWLARFLKLMGWVMLLGLIYWCFSGLGSDQKTKVERYHLDVSELSPGESKAFSLGNQPLIVVHRSQSQIDSLRDELLNDAGSWQSNDPNGLDTRHRGAVQEWIVVEALGTQLNCPVEVRAAGGSFQGRPWPGGFADKCRDQRYDWAGRVYAEQGAKRNLKVMHYTLMSGPSLAIKLR